MANRDEERRRRARNRSFVDYDERNTPYDRNLDPDYPDEELYQQDLKWCGRWDSDQGLGRDFSRGESQRYPRWRDRDDDRPDELRWTYDNERNRRLMMDFYGPQSAEERWWDRDAERRARPRAARVSQAEGVTRLTRSTCLKMWMIMIAITGGTALTVGLDPKDIGGPTRGY